MGELTHYQSHERHSGNATPELRSNLDGREPKWHDKDILFDRTRLTRVSDKESDFAGDGNVRMSIDDLKALDKAAVSHDGLGSIDYAAYRLNELFGQTIRFGGDPKDLQQYINENINGKGMEVRFEPGSNPSRHGISILDSSRTEQAISGPYHPVLGSSYGPQLEVSKMERAKQQ